jgi:hypothetical protein
LGTQVIEVFADMENADDGEHTATATVMDAPIAFPRQVLPGLLDPPRVLGALREKAPLIPMRFAAGPLGWFETSRPARHHVVVDLPMAEAFVGRRS